MDINTLNKTIGAGLPDLEEREALKDPARPRTSLRLQYEAHVEVIQKQIGDLEQIRLKLNLSRRKISQLLMVDPSAWTRWTKQGEKAPPHIYRALEWYLLLQKEQPHQAHSYWLATVGGRTDQDAGMNKRLGELTKRTRILQWTVLALSLLMFFMVYSTYF